MKAVRKTVGIAAAIILIATLINWNYIVKLMGLTFNAAISVVSEESVSGEFQAEMDSLGIEKFINVGLFNQFMQDNHIKDENGQDIDLNSLVNQIIAGDIPDLYSDQNDEVCFVQDTLVRIPNGYEKIQNIKPGDFVYSKNAETGQTGYKEVKDVFVKETFVIVVVKTTGSKTQATRQHPFYVTDQGWTRAEDLQLGDRLENADGRVEIVETLEIKYVAMPVRVYNVEVMDWHTYFVSESAILVHNSCTPEAGNDQKSEIEIAHELADDILRQAQNAEPNVTKTMKSLETEGAYLEGLDYRLKSIESLSRKILSDAHVQGISLEEAAAKIGDSLRYTLVAGEAAYADIVINSLETLRNSSYVINKVKNYWGDDLYQGINIAMTSPEGIKMELQFHTEASYYTKEVLNHSYYEIVRSETATAEEIIKATEAMIANQSKVAVPPGAKDITRIGDS